MTRIRLLLLAGLCAGLAACTTPPANQPWPAALHAEGAPPLSAKLLEGVRRYTQIAGHQLIDWHPIRRELLVSHRPIDAETAQLYRMASPLGVLQPLTSGSDPVRSAQWEPRQGRFIVFARSQGGDEADQLYRLDPDTLAHQRLTEPMRRHTVWGWFHQTSAMLVASVPLDRTAAGGSRDRIETVLHVIDPMNPEAARVVARLPGTGWSGAAIAPDDRRVAVSRSRSTTDSELWLLDLHAKDAAPRRILPASDADDRAVYRPAVFAKDGRSLYLRSDRSGEFRELVQWDLTGGGLRRLTAHIPWDVNAVELSEDGGTLALLVDAAGKDEVHFVDTATGQAQLAPHALAGTVSRLRWHATRGTLAVQTSSAQGPGRVVEIHPSTPDVQAWTRPSVPDAIDPSRFVEARAVTWTGHDGLALSGWWTQPDPTRFPGRRPVVMLMHGGPASQSDAGWMGRHHYLVEELGVAVLQPNVRGSSGFGKTFLGLDDGLKREDSVGDMGALLDWIGRQPLLDAGRVVVMGGSYGGYMSLAASVQYADRIAGAVSTVGISNFVSFLENTESYRRDHRRSEYGDERNPEMRAFLNRISPLNQVDKIRKPLLVVQGRNDPRVPWTESEQIVRRLQARGGVVWYLLADNEGHGFARRENADAYFATVVRFLEHSWAQ